MFCYHCMRDKGDAIRCPYCGQGNVIDPSTHHLPVGSVISGRYVLGRVLGEGGFGITYIGFDSVLETRVAVKEYFPFGITIRNVTQGNTVTVSSSSDDGSFDKGKQRFLNEAQNLARFNHERGIVNVTDFIEENNTAYIIMEYLEGVDLRQCLRQYGAITVDQTLTILLPVIQSLQRIHEANIIHRDISPDNLMVLNDGSVKLMDFGAARTYVDDNRSMSVMLKKGYAPEEQYRSNGKQGPWTDVYGICATFYRCITGKTPEESLERIFEDHLERPSALGADISPAMEEVLLYGLAIRKEDRCQSMEELYRLLLSAYEDPNGHPVRSSKKPETTEYRTEAADETPTTAAAEREELTQAANTVALSQDDYDVPAPQNSVSRKTAAYRERSYRPSELTEKDPVTDDTGEADQPEKKFSVLIKILIGLIVIAVIVLGIFLFHDDKTTTSKTYGSGLGSSSFVSSTTVKATQAEMTQAEMTEISTGAQKFTVAEQTKEAKRFQSYVDYIFDNVDTTGYYFSLTPNEKNHLSENGCYTVGKTDYDEPTNFHTVLKHDAFDEVDFSPDITIAGKTYTLCETTLQDILDDGWEYTEEDGAPEANSTKYQSVHLQKDSTSLSVSIRKTGDEPTQALIESFSGYAYYSSSKTTSLPSFSFQGFSDTDDIKEICQKGLPEEISIYSHSIRLNFWPNDLYSYTVTFSDDEDPDSLSMYRYHFSTMNF